MSRWERRGEQVKLVSLSTNSKLAYSPKSQRGRQAFACTVLVRHLHGRFTYRDWAWSL